VQYVRLSRTEGDLYAKRADAQKKFGRNSGEAALYSQAMDALERVMGKIEQGKTPEPAELKAMEAVRVLHFGSADDLAQLLSSSPAEAAAMRATLDGVSNFTDATKGKDGSVRSSMVSFASRAQEAALNGKMPEFLAHAMAFSAYSKASNE